MTRFMDGLYAGIQYYNEKKGTNVELLGWDGSLADPTTTGTFVGGSGGTDTWNDPAKGEQFAKTFLDQGVDIVHPVAGETGNGTIKAMLEAGKWAIGVDTDQSISIGPPTNAAILTSAQKAIDVSVLDVIKKIAGGDLGGEDYSGTLANNGVLLSPVPRFRQPDLGRDEGRDRGAQAGDRRRQRHGLHLPRRAAASQPERARDLSRSHSTAPGPHRGPGAVCITQNPVEADPMRLELRDITKRFPGVLANDKISIAADRGKVLGLLGENGAGKTTLMNILSGLYKPDSGQILIDGEEQVFGDPAAAIDAGVGMVHQHFMLVPVFDVVEAVALGAETVTRPARHASIGPRRGKRIVELSEQYKLDVDPDAKIESLPVGVRQRVEILKALYRQSDILVLDEPSAVLTPYETEELFGDHPVARRERARRSSSSPTSSTRCSRSRTTSSCCAADASPARRTRRRRPARSWPT